MTCYINNKAFTGQYSRTINDLIELEESFKHNLELLRIKSSEIERCNGAIRKMENLIRDHLKEINDLKSTINTLEVELRKSEEERSFEKDVYVKTKRLLELELVKTKEDLKLQKDAYEVEVHNVRKQGEERFVRLRQEKEGYRAREIEDIKKKLLAEKNQMVCTEKIVDELSLENRHLKEKLRATELRISSDTFNNKNQLNQLNDCNTILQKELNKFANNFNNQSAELNVIKTERNRLLQEINEQKANLLQLKCDNDKMKNDIANYIKTIEEINLQMLQHDDDGVCCIKEHENYDDLIKQNNILQDVVKEMRRERKENLQNVKTIQDAEKRIEYLEDVLDMLKEEPE